MSLLQILANNSVLKAFFISLACLRKKSVYRPENTEFKVLNHKRNRKRPFFLLVSNTLHAICYIVQQKEVFVYSPA